MGYINACNNWHISTGDLKRQVSQQLLKTILATVGA